MAVSKRKVSKPVKKTAAKATTKKKAPAKRATSVKAKKPAAKAVKAAKPAAPAKITVGSKAYTKSDLIRTLTEQTGLARKDVVGVLESLTSVIAAHLAKRGPEMFAWPGILKMKIVNKPATKARKGVNPFTGEPAIFKAKPASRKVKILPLKQLKEMAN